jgi:hypothetical protein
MLSRAAFTGLNLCFQTNWRTGFASIQWDAKQKRLLLRTDKLPRRLWTSIYTTCRIIHFFYTLFRSLQFLGNGGSAAKFILQLLFISQTCIGLAFHFNTMFRGDAICHLTNKYIQLDQQLSGMFLF